jgi:FKBP12-rapamycin complex-associated protein
VLEDHLQLLLPALSRLIAPGGAGLPQPVQEEALSAMQDLLPRMQLAGFSSAVLHPLIRLLDGPSDALRQRALDTLCSVALAVGPDFAIFVPTVKKARRGGGGGWAHPRSP